MWFSEKYYFKFLQKLCIRYFEGKKRKIVMEKFEIDIIKLPI